MMKKKSLAEGCVNVMSQFCSTPAKWFEAYHTMVEVMIGYEGLKFDPVSWSPTPENKKKVLEESPFYQEARKLPSRKQRNLVLPGEKKSFLSTKLYGEVSSCKGNSGILAYFYAPTLQDWLDTLRFVRLPGTEGNALSDEWISELKRSENSSEGFLYVITFGYDFAHTFSVLSCPYGKVRLFFLFQGFSDEYTVCDWSRNEVKSTVFEGFRAPMTLQAIVHFATLWKSLEGTQYVTPVYIDTYRKLTGVTIPPTRIEQKVDSYILVKTLRFDPSTLDKQIQSRFQILEKFSWIVPSSIEEECRLAEGYFGKNFPSNARLGLLQESLENATSEKLRRLKRSRSFVK
jgi:hypothetical protein